MGAGWGGGGGWGSFSCKTVPASSCCFFGKARYSEHVHIVNVARPEKQKINHSAETSCTF